MENKRETTNVIRAKVRNIKTYRRDISEVEDDYLQKQLYGATDEFESKDYSGAIKTLAYCFHMVETRLAHQFGIKLHNDIAPMSSLVQWQKAEDRANNIRDIKLTGIEVEPKVIEKIFDVIARELADVRRQANRAVALSVLDLIQSEAYFKLEHYVLRIFDPREGTIDIQLSSCPEITTEDAEDALAFVIDATLRAQKLGIKCFSSFAMRRKTPN